MLVTLPRTDFYTRRLAELHQRLLSSKIAQEHLSGAGIRLDGEELNDASPVTLPSGTGLTTLEFAHLFTAFDKSRVHGQADKGVGKDDAPPGFYFTIVNGKLLPSLHKNRLGLFVEEAGDSKLYIENLHIDHFFLNEHQAPVGLGTVALALCAITAHLAGLSVIQLVAAGGQGHNPRHIGYKVWPRLGFNALLLPGETAAVPSLSQCVTVLDVLALDQQWWDQNGSQRMMIFELEADSASWEKLLSYLSEKVFEGAQHVQ